MEKFQIEEEIQKSYGSLKHLNLIFRVKQSSNRLFQVEVILNSNIIIQSFSLDFTIYSSYNGKMELPEGFRGKGWGRALVKNREILCKNLGIRFILINNCENYSFWEKMNYKLVGMDLFDYFNKVNPQIFMDEEKYQPSRYKEI